MSSKTAYLHFWHHEELIPKACTGVSICILFYVMGQGWLWI